MKFNVKNMARISNASIEIKPLTIFIGKNGTNKSYMAHLVYELYKEIKNLEQSDYFIESKIGQAIIRDYISNVDKKNMLEKITMTSKKVQRNMQYDEDVFEMLTLDEYKFSLKNLDEIGLLEDIYTHTMQSLLKKINSSYSTKLTIIENFDLNYNYSDIFHMPEIEITVPESNNVPYPRLIKKLFEIVYSFLNQQVDAEDFFYFPSSRTGFVLAFDEIVSGIFRDRFGGKPTGTKLTVPTIDFLSNFVDIKTGKFEEDKDYFFFSGESDETENIPETLLSFLESMILKGEIIEDKNEEDYTQYSLRTANDVILDLHLTSTATLELLPLIVFMKHFKRIKNKLLVIEEPEAHLHPHAQKLMAKYLVMLINYGAKVIITTHSDYIIKELNSSLHCGNYNNDENCEKLNDDDVTVYLFKEQENTVEVMQLDIDESNAIPIDSFNDINHELEE